MFHLKHKNTNNSVGHPPEAKKIPSDAPAGQETPCKIDAAQISDEAKEKIFKEEPNILAQTIDAEKKKAQDYYDQLASLKAEFDNYRKRMEKEAADLIKAGRKEVLSAFLPIMDDIYRVHEAISKNESGVKEAVDIVFRKIEKIIADFRVRKMECDGKEFSPHVHSAVLAEKTDKHKNGIILKVLSNGYYLGDEILKPASVVVAKNEKPPPAQEEMKDGK
ncbi:MAG: nucleotide exchange factor GrpE [Elusimicrobia bacterium CG08_land_8_20_14_0_20_44_26]|nr:MAG: nucleotide exchange factor GrpE [Elusimicrobia bacterium CG08_land_8_20_14_0_20_44_26]